MGYNTVAVLYNDVLDIIRREPKFGEIVYQGFLGYQQARNPRDANFVYGEIISCEHADYDQLVVVGQNRGRQLRDVDDPSPMMLLEMKEFMEKHGYRVVKKRK